MFGRLFSFSNQISTTPHLVSGNTPWAEEEWREQEEEMVAEEVERGLPIRRETGLVLRAASPRPSRRAFPISRV